MQTSDRNGTARPAPKRPLAADEAAHEMPHRIVVYGEPGTGKTTFAVSAPRPYVIDMDFGTMSFKVGRDHPNTWEELVATVERLRDEEHPYKTLVLDTVDRAEVKCWEYLRAKLGAGPKDRRPVATIEEVNGGYGKGYNTAHEEFRKLFGIMEACWRKRGMNVVIVAHAALENIKSTDAADYQRHNLKLHKYVSHMFQEVADAVLFARRNVIVSKDVHDAERFRAIGGESIQLHTKAAPGFVAKNRYNLPAKIEMSWDALVAGIAQGRSPALLVDTIRDKVRRLGDAALGEKVEAAIAGAGNDPGKLIQINARLATRMDEMQQREAEAAKTESSAEETTGGEAPAEN